MTGESLTNPITAFDILVEGRPDIATMESSNLCRLQNTVQSGASWLTVWPGIYDTKPSALTCTRNISTLFPFSLEVRAWNLVWPENWGKLWIGIIAERLPGMLAYQPWLSTWGCESVLTGDGNGGQNCFRLPCTPLMFHTTIHFLHLVVFIRIYLLHVQHKVGTVNLLEDNLTYSLHNMVTLNMT